jgi:hypothetical protein
MRHCRALVAIAILWAAGPLAAEKLSFAKVQDLIKGFKADVFSQDQTIDLIRSSGVDFELTPERRAQLRRLNPGDAILNVIQEVAIVQPPLKGTLSLRCAPAECDIKFNGQPAGRTANGVLVVPGLDLPRDIIVDFGKAAYITQQKSVRLTSTDPSAALSVTLELSNAGKAANGKILLAAMMGALGAQEGLDKLWSLIGSGSMKSYTGGKQSDWDFDVALLGPAQMEMAAKNASGSLMLQCAFEKCEEKKKGTRLSLNGKQLREPAAAEIETNLRGFFQYNLAALLRNLKEPSIQASSLTADQTGAAEQHLTAEASDIVYDITLGTDMLPSVVTYSSKTGLGGLTMTFGDYLEVSGGHYPKRTTIRLKEGSQDGIEVRLGKLIKAPPLQK